ncbi:ATP-dependent Lhr-like helicase [Nakamurella flavida]|uniref:Lhr family helicase n=1 Tax=Nakamurella flavida TaxID=363630 RepID=UPI001F05C182|nr:DEAD/DEAH box helicase [Nakamurella flavida]MDP9778024.1 ATP-dependent Lhr-like helicase [Nakamurella flavida]
MTTRTAQSPAPRRRSRVAESAAAAPSVPAVVGGAAPGGPVDPVADPVRSLDRFSPVVREWFTTSFAEPTQAQAGAWDAIGRGEHTLVVAPTGSGKTLSAFLSGIDTLVNTPPVEDAQKRCTVLYLSPLKALAVDVERNLRSPLIGIGSLAARAGVQVPEISVAVRSGDTPAGDRRAFAKDGADILITTPESLFLLLTSRAREMLSGVTTVILDEVHAVAGTKRGAHLAVSLDRLDAMLDRPAQRIGLSATVRPVEEVARFLTGGRPVTVVRPVSTKRIDVDVVVPVADMSALGAPSGDLTGVAAGEVPRTSIWPHVEERVVDLILEHRSTIVFANSRRLAERLTARLNEIHAERLALADPPADADDDDGAVAGNRPRQPGLGAPAHIMAQAGLTGGAAAVLAKAHHGSVSREQRALIEDELKTGRLPAVVATSSLELGVDMGAVDLVIQVESPPSVASGLQRIGRAGHQVGAPSHGVVFPKYRGDLISSAVVAGRMRSGSIEALRVLSNPLDIAAQQIVAICAMDSITVDDLHDLLRRSAPFAALGRGALEAVLDMLSGRYPSEQFAELRPRLTWDRVTGELTGRPGAQRLAVTSGGTIPDRGLYGVFLATSESSSGRAPRRVGELDEEMVYESRVGDVFALGSSSWQIVEITHDQVLVLPAPGLPGRLPFWKGDTLGRPAELGRAHGEFVREISSQDRVSATAQLTAAGLDAFATDNLLAYLDEQRAAVGVVPDEKTLVLERFQDELGDWRLVLHSPYGAAVHAPWALIIAARMRERYGVDVQAMHSDDGIVLRLPDVEYGAGDFGGGAGDLGDDGDGGGGGAMPWGDLGPFSAGGPGGGGFGAGGFGAGGATGGPAVLDAIALDPNTVEAEVTAEIGGSAVFASRFRECAARALLLPRRQIGKRQPLWQQRQRASQLLEVAAQYPSFPIVAEAVRECLSDVFDVPALVDLMRQLDGRVVKVVEVNTQTPSPFAKSLLFGYVAQFLYEGDSPLAERRAAALTVDPALLAELLGGGDGLALRDLLDPDAVRSTEQDLQRLTENRRARNLDEIADLLRILGPLTQAEIQQRSLVEDVAPVLQDLLLARRAILVRIGGLERWADPADAWMLRDALGTALPPGIAASLMESQPDPLGRLLGRFARTRGPFTVGGAALTFGLGTAVVTDALRRLVGSGRLAEGEFRPPGAAAVPIAGQDPGDAADGGPTGREFVDAEVLRLLRRRSLAALRAEVEPVPPQALGRFLPAWNGVASSRASGRARGVSGVLRAVEQLAGAIVPASALESLILPARVAGYQPALLDELTAAGEVIWTGHGALAGSDGWVSLHLADSAALTLPLTSAEGIQLGGPPVPPAVPAADPAAAPAVTPAADGATPADAAAAADVPSPGDPVPPVRPPTERPTGALPRAVLEVLSRGGAYFFRPLVDAAQTALLAAGGSRASDKEWEDVLWELVFAGLVTGDTLAPLRARLTSGSTAHKTAAPTARPRQRSMSGLALLSARGRAAPTARRGSPATVAGRWSLIPEVETDPTIRASATAEVLLDRYGIVTRGAVVAEGTHGGFAGVYRVLSAFEEAGRVRRGYFVEGLGAAQFAGPGAVDRVRAFVPSPDEERPALEAFVLAAADPANPYGAALPWPDRSADVADKHRPARRAGAMVVLVDGALVFYAERGGRSLLSFADDPDVLRAASQALVERVRAGSLGALTVTRLDGADVLLDSGAVVQALTAEGFTITPRGLRLRPAPRGG